MGFFFSNQKMDLLKASQENLEKSQRNLELMVQQRFPEKTEVNGSSQNEETSNVDLKRVAYALNCCTVSVSQIIEYDDVYILEQEYESILNNLNLEVMPKDEALLDVLKQLLNTITFFRIQEGDKAMLDKEYQQRMKNAIWSCVPNIGVIFAGGNWATAAVSLVSQIGIGYMNYRREKAKNNLEYEKQQWQLMRSALEQLNGLRRELFDAAWRLADRYHFPDSYRITEHQISMYNRILMEADPLKRYERLAYIKDKFEAYPPFLYHLANAASSVALDNRATYPSLVKIEAAKEAKKLFQEYLDATDRNLFREDHIRATCALEYFNLLLTDGETEKDKLNSLLDIAIDAAGNSYDVLEMCAFSYAGIGEHIKASEILRMLVNEGYNTIVNAQLLSSLYVKEYVSSPCEYISGKYKTLSDWVGKEYLFPLPTAVTASVDQVEALNNQFFTCQKQILLTKYSYALKDFIEKYTVLFNRSIPTAIEKRDYPDSYFLNDTESIQRRVQDVLDLFEKGKGDGYISRLHFLTQDMLNVLNSIYVALDKLPFVNGTTLLQCLKERITDKADTLCRIQESISQHTLNQGDIRKIFVLTFEMFTESAFKSVVEDIRQYVDTLSTMENISKAEAVLREFCDAEGIHVPQIMLSKGVSITDRKAENLPEISIDLLGSNAAMYQREMGKIKEMEQCVKEHQKKQSVIKGGSTKIEYLVKGTPAFDKYIERNSEKLKKCAWSILSVINDSSWKNDDWILTSTGVRRFYSSFIFGKELSGAVTYHSIKFNNKDHLHHYAGDLTDDRIDHSAVRDLVNGLAEIARKFLPNEKESIQLPDENNGNMALRLSASLLDSTSNDATA